MPVLHPRVAGPRMRPEFEVPGEPLAQDDAPVGPPVGPPMVQRRSVVIGLVVAAVVAGVIVLGLALSGGGGKPGTAANPTIPVSGSILLSSASCVTDNGDGTCAGSGGYSDISAGVQVVITDNLGKTVAISSLEAGTGSSGTCTFAFHASVPARVGSYGVAVSHRGTIEYDEKRIASPALTLGDGS